VSQKNLPCVWGGLLLVPDDHWDPLSLKCIEDGYVGVDQQQEDGRGHSGKGVGTFREEFEITAWLRSQRKSQLLTEGTMRTAGGESLVGVRLLPKEQKLAII